ncbi:MAG: DUF4474 domain-containing protein [Lachnospiraceae bacterium]|jgi:hypothetical protein|nr:DUF4474 domain-containing protein [Lachnospiraceae bacterium]
MYFLLLALLLSALLGCIFLQCQRKKIICKINSMDCCAKCSFLNELVYPFGYDFHCDCGFFSSTVDAPQRQAGYSRLYDYMAPRFQMVFDSLPVYFDYRGRTWLIEFWKGQYGINTGAEIGIYHADHIIPESDYKNAWFSCAENNEMLDCSFRLCRDGDECVCSCGRHWWLTAFLVGSFSKPACLTMESCITFPGREMLAAFVDGLKRAGCSEDCMSVRGLTVCFVFHRDHQKYNCITRFWRRFSQWKNKCFCKLYLWVTRPFSCTEDRVLYLYFYLPMAFRKLLRLRRFHKRCHRQYGREG